MKTRLLKKYRKKSRKAVKIRYSRYYREFKIYIRENSLEDEHVVDKLYRQQKICSTRIDSELIKALREHQRKWVLKQVTVERQKRDLKEWEKWQKRL